MVMSRVKTLNIWKNTNNEIDIFALLQRNKKLIHSHLTHSSLRLKRHPSIQAGLKFVIPRSITCSTFWQQRGRRHRRGHCPHRPLRRCVHCSPRSRRHRRIDRQAARPHRPEIRDSIFAKGETSEVARDESASE